jgi:hypothetical protein
MKPFKRVLPIMKAVIFSALLCGLASCGHLVTAAASSTPYVSMSVREQDRKALLQAAGLARDGRYDEAGALLKTTEIPSVIRVAIGVPGSDAATGKAAIDKAISAWNDALKDGRKMEMTADASGATIVVDFLPSAMDSSDGFGHPACSGISIESDSAAQKGKARKARIQIATVMPGTPNAPHSMESVCHLVSRGFGLFFGLAPSADVNLLMGPDPHRPSASFKPTPDDIAVLNGMESYRSVVQKSVTSKSKPDLHFPTLKFTQMRCDGGEVWKGETMKFEFEYKNEGDAPLEIDAHPACGCTVAKFDRIVQPGASGKLIASLNTNGFKGTLGKTIDVYANTPDGEKVTLMIAGKVKPVFEVLPGEPVVFSLDDKDHSLRELTIRPLEDPKTKILSVEGQLPYVKAKVDPVPNDKGAYKVTLDFAPEAPRGRFGMGITVKTDSKREPQISLPVTFEKGIYAMPPTLFVGIVNGDTKLPVSRTISVLRKDRAFKVTGVKADDPLLETTLETVKDGHEYRIKMAYKGGWKMGNVSRKLTVSTDDPGQPTIDIPVLANVMAEVGGK